MSDEAKKALEETRNKIFYWMTRNPASDKGAYELLKELKEEITEALSALEAERGDGPNHLDYLAVDHFAEAMKEKLAKKRNDGKSGWQYVDVCSTEFLSESLHRHVSKGDPIDVANFCMMLFTRGDTIKPHPPAVAGDRAEGFPRFIETGEKGVSLQSHHQFCFGGHTFIGKAASGEDAQAIVKAANALTPPANADLMAVRDKLLSIQIDARKIRQIYSRGIYENAADIGVAAEDALEILNRLMGHK